MGFERDYRGGSSSVQVGHGGLGCACCCPYNCHPRNAKPLMRRIARRVLKVRLAAEIRRGEED